jgi:Sec-independent protein translocase protein TatA
MDFLGIGPLELLFILIIILVVLGPNEMVKTGALIGRYLRKLMMSPTWKLIQDTSREIRYLPNKLARQAGLDEIQKEVREGLDLPKIGGIPKQNGQDKRFEAWTNPTEQDPAPAGLEPEGAADPPTEANEPTPSPLPPADPEAE